jgi:hypothetical protein
MILSVEDRCVVSDAAARGTFSLAATVPVLDSIASVRF